MAAPAAARAGCAPLRIRKIRWNSTTVAPIKHASSKCSGNRLSNERFRPRYTERSDVLTSLEDALMPSGRLR